MLVLGTVLSIYLERIIALMSINYTKDAYQDYEASFFNDELLEEAGLSLNDLLVNDLLLNERRMADIQKKQKLLEAEIATKNFEIAAKDSEIEALKREILRLNGFLGMDGTNSGLPTSQTPISKKKVIPNSRVKSGKTIGGQPGHAKQKLEAFSEDDITERRIHELQTCPHCGSQEILKTEESVHKDELDYEVVVIKRRHYYPQYHCSNCGHNFHAPIADHLKEENQYGSRVPALALSLMNIGNVSVNKARKMIYGLSEEGINPSEGYLIKEQKKAGKALASFQEELRKACLQKELLYWDDTVIAINKKRGCLRYYGDEKTALYTAHLTKGKEGLDEDRILKELSEQTVVMHDHNKINYNPEYGYGNVECNVHLLRELQKTADNLPHKWSTELSELLKKTNAERNTAIEKGSKAFDEEYIKTFFEEYDRIMLGAIRENREDYNKYYGKDEGNLILRILRYKDNYLSWVVNFDLPFSNNVSERALRGVKSKMKISGQFQTEEMAKNYAAVRSYIETSYRNGVNEMEALIRLCEGRPYTLAELLKPRSDI